MGDTQTGRIEVERPRNVVWRSMSVLAEIPTWYGDWDRCDHDSQHLQVQEGVRFRLTAGRGPFNRAANCDIITAQEPALLRWIEHRRLRPPELVEFRLTAISSERTLVTHIKTVGTRPCT